MSYDPANDMANFVQVYDEYTQATASAYRPDIQKAIDTAEELENRAARVKDYWQARKNGCLSPKS